MSFQFPACFPFFFYLFSLISLLLTITVFWKMHLSLIPKSPLHMRKWYMVETNICQHEIHSFEINGFQLLSNFKIRQLSYAPSLSCYTKQLQVRLYFQFLTLNACILILYFLLFSKFESYTFSQIFNLQPACTCSFIFFVFLVFQYYSSPSTKEW